MRAPRALIPLLAVAGAAGVVATAGAGAAIKEATTAPAPLADAAQDVPFATVHALTWNVCGDTGCPMGADPAGLVGQISRRLAESQVGGRGVTMNAVFLQDVCAGHIAKLRTVDRLRSWSWAFAPERVGGGAERRCGNGQGELGVAIGTESALSDVQKVRLPSPGGHGRSAVCATATSWQARLCGVRLSSGRWDDDPHGRWRARQIGKLTELAAGPRMIIGGDLTERPEARVLDPLYARFAECDQGPGESRTGAMTRTDERGTAIAKTDYLFISKSAGVSCGVAPGPVRASDHYPLAAAVRFH